MKTTFISAICFPLLVFGLTSHFASMADGQDSLERLYQRVDRIPASVSDNETCLVPNSIEAPTVATVRYQTDENLQGTDATPAQPDARFRDRVAVDLNGIGYNPEPLGRALMRRKANLKKPTYAGEFLYDGADAGKPVVVDNTWNVYGLGIEDTVGHFDTLDGRRLVSPSNRVEIYAPRFSAVRRVEDFNERFAAVSPRQFEEEQPTLSSQTSDPATTTKQHEQPMAHKNADRASSIIDQTRGVVADTSLRLFGTRNSFSPFENLEIMRFGRFSSAEQARLDLGIQSANVWQDDLGLQVAVDNAQPIIVNDVSRVQELEAVESKDNAILRVVKIASHVAARPGDIVEFTIRFDNMSKRKVGNVTILDNLTSRLEYVEGSAESSHDAVFKTRPNEAGSLELRWEIRDPIAAGKGGLVSFKCRVR